MVNLDELRKKYDAIQKAQSGGGGNDDFLKKFFMMEEGTSVIRVLPAKEDSDNEFYAETAIHRINDKNYHCPRVKGGDCPVCDLYYRLWKVEGPMKDEAQDLARQIKPRKRYYMNVVDRRDSSVKILSMGMKLFGKILDCFFDEDYGDITDLKEGWDFKVIKIPKVNGRTTINQVLSLSNLKLGLIKSVQSGWTSFMIFTGLSNFLSIPS